MKIHHQAPHPELDFLVKAPLRLELAGGDSLFVMEWSSSEFRYAQSDAIPRYCHLCIPFQVVDLRFPVIIEKVSDDEIYQFSGLNGCQREALAVFYRSVLSGKTDAMDDVIVSLDATVDLVPMGETEEEKSAELKKVKPRILRILCNVFYYAVLSFVCSCSATRVTRT